MTGVRYYLPMSTNQTANAYLNKAEESLDGAESECVNRRFNNCVNRAYYAAFQAAISALVREGIRAKRGNQWSHAYVQAEFVGKLINRNRRYPPALRSVLSDLLLLRSHADYRSNAVSEIEAQRALRKSREFFKSIQSGGGKSS